MPLPKVVVCCKLTVLYALHYSYGISVGQFTYLCVKKANPPLLLARIFC